MQGAHLYCKFEGEGDMQGARLECDCGIEGGMQCRCLETDFGIEGDMHGGDWDRRQKIIRFGQPAEANQKGQQHLE